jgi:hypothetical protein
VRALPLTLLFAASAHAFGQFNPPAAPIWQMQESGTTAGRRGIDSVDGTLAWASGTGGTVLKTFDGGNWNALLLPFVVGPNGRIARINPAALPAAKTAP